MIQCISSKVATGWAHCIIMISGAEIPHVSCYKKSGTITFTQNTQSGNYKVPVVLSVNEYNELKVSISNIDDYYKQIRGNILASQVEELKSIIVKKIKEYKGIDEELIRRIANISETEIPASEIGALKMHDYINDQKAILIFNTMDKKAYKRDLERAFNSQTVEQFIAYKGEVIKVAQQRTAEMVEEFKNNIDTISGSLELLIKDENRAIEEQRKAKEVLELVERKDAELNKKIWGES